MVPRKSLRGAVASFLALSLSWVQGVGIPELTSRLDYNKTFYLGTPVDLVIGDVGACALFFTNTTSMVEFNGTNAGETQGTCQEAMSESCVAAMNERAESIDYDGLTIDEACTKLKEEFDDNLDSECKSFASSSKWEDVTVKALSGPSENPITEKTNGSTTCWPILPKSDNLNIVATFATFGNTSARSIVDQLYDITPVLTVFFPGNGTLITKVESQMTCMKSMGDSSANNLTKSNGGEDEDEVPGNDATALVAGVGVKMTMASILGIILLL
ncbi:hypothetical protein G7Z17_g1654 [Cylindrodendrum hubeiense]|uniref:Uncharacterized protein n=1 Tax=Cylindrodendrum hubeiense TaxID=595255 RepID=A0A9P5HEF4_9HYPO|nr:hypothetical protein G7Z17_g1654 [Cylindrodendrum hubeiense]